MNCIYFSIVVMEYIMWSSKQWVFSKCLINSTPPLCLSVFLKTICLCFSSIYPFSVFLSSFHNYYILTNRLSPSYLSITLSQTYISSKALSLTLSLPPSLSLTKSCDYSIYLCKMYHGISEDIMVQCINTFPLHSVLTHYQEKDSHNFYTNMIYI